MIRHLFDPRLWLLTVMMMAWAYRARLALRTLPKVPSLKPPPAPGAAALSKKVSVLIPAKNEEKNIRECVERFLAQDHPGLEIIIANDNSTDQTGEILKSFGDRIKTIQVPPTPAGWTGKNYALHTAVSSATGQWFLFTDADTRHEPSSVSASLKHTNDYDLKFLTLLPRCLAASLAEKIIQPTAMGYTGLWFPPDEINDPHSPATFGNGQYLFIERKHYEKLGGHSAVRGEFLEDFALMRKSKEAGARSQVAFGVQIYGTRMYDSLTAIWRGWRRIYLHAFRQQPWVLVKKVLSVFFYSVIPFAGFVPVAVSYARNPEANGLVFGFHSALLLFILATAWKTYSLVKANRLYAFLHPVAALVIGMILMDAAWMAFAKQETKWR